VGSLYAEAASNVILLFDLATGSHRTFSLVPPGETGEGYDWGATDVAFTPEGRLLVAGSGGVRWIDADTGVSDWIWRLPKDETASSAVDADGRRLVVGTRGKNQKTSGLVFIDLRSGTRRTIGSHGSSVTAVALDGPGRTLVTGDEEGTVRVGLADGSEPFRLCCHEGVVTTVSISPDGHWIASSSGGEIRLWPMPDLTKPPLQTLPYAELMVKLGALTNLQVVADETSPTGYKIDIGPFPGWKDVPTW
jgi:WD40 repeat protein